jgi:hypothetical protein
MASLAQDSSLSAPDTLAVGLQEWAGLCRALLDGRLLLSVRKGGIHERHGGLFSPEHPRFALLPTHLHQAAERVQPAFRADLDQPVPAAGTIPVAGWCTVERVWKAGDLGRIQDLGGELAWTADELANRFAYRGQPFLYVLALRAWRLPAVQAIADHPSYAGCRSWIPLTEAIATAGSRPAVPDTAFAARLAAIATHLDRP